MPDALDPAISDAELLDASRAEVARRFREADDSSLHYHNFEHTREVVAAVQLIAKLEGIGEQDTVDLCLAAWWHDVGMLEHPASGHEARSVSEAKLFLKEQGLPEARIEKIGRLILATRPSHPAEDKLDRIIKDADMSGLGRPGYKSRLKNLRREWNRSPDSETWTVKDADWLADNISFLKQHKYLSSSAARLYSEQKTNNISKLEKQLKKLEKKEAKLKAKNSQRSAIQSEKSAQMMLKTTLRNNIDLTSIADGKANIMLTISAAIISLGMPLLAAYIPEYTYLIFPSAILLITCILTIYYATLATRPVKTSGTTDLNTLKSGKSNLFFFGNYYNMDLEEYRGGLREVLSDQKALDDSVINDLYSLGVALGQKFNRLRTCYAVFLVGIVLTALAFIIAFYINGPLSGEPILQEGFEVPQLRLPPPAE